MIDEYSGAPLRIWIHPVTYPVLPFFVFTAMVRIHWEALRVP